MSSEAYTLGESETVLTRHILTVRHHVTRDSFFNVTCDAIGDTPVFVENGIFQTVVPDLHTYVLKIEEVGVGGIALANPHQEWYWDGHDNIKTVWDWTATVLHDDDASVEVSFDKGSLYLVSHYETSYCIGVATNEEVLSCFKHGRMSPWIRHDQQNQARITFGAELTTDSRVAVLVRAVFQKSYPIDISAACGAISGSSLLCGDVSGFEIFDKFIYVVKFKGVSAISASQDVLMSLHAQYGPQIVIEQNPSPSEYAVFVTVTSDTPQVRCEMKTNIGFLVATADSMFWGNSVEFKHVVRMRPLSENIGQYEIDCVGYYFEGHGYFLTQSAGEQVAIQTPFLRRDDTASAALTVTIVTPPDNRVCAELNWDECRPRDDCTFYFIDEGEITISGSRVIESTFFCTAKGASVPRPPPAHYISVSGAHLVVGGFEPQSNSNKIKIFHDGIFIQQINQQSSSFGESISVNGNLLAVGAPTLKTVFVYEYLGAVIGWAILKSIRMDNDIWFGLSVSFKDGALAIASMTNIYVYKQAGVSVVEATPTEFPDFFQPVGINYLMPRSLHMDIQFLHAVLRTSPHMYYKQMVYERNAGSSGMSFVTGTSEWFDALQRNISVHHSDQAPNFRFAVSGNSGEYVYVWARETTYTGGVSYAYTQIQNITLPANRTCSSVYMIGDFLLVGSSGNGDKQLGKVLFYYAGLPGTTIPSYTDGVLQRLIPARVQYTKFAELEGNTSYYGTAVYGAQIGPDFFAYTFESSSALSLKVSRVPNLPPPAPGSPPPWWHRPPPPLPPPGPPVSPPPPLGQPVRYPLTGTAVSNVFAPYFVTWNSSPQLFILENSLTWDTYS
ncbi:MAG: hypothetical protein QMC37_09370, partial [Flavobacteriales bacterium]